MRVRGADNSREGYLFTFAEPELKRFAANIQTELPNSQVVYNAKRSTGISSEANQQIGRNNSGLLSASDVLSHENQTIIEVGSYTGNSFKWNFRGDFREQIINTFSQI